MKILGKIALLAIAAASLVPVANAEKLIILATNDTHSQIEPAADNKGGVLRRRAVIDSVRNAEKNVLLVDAGDVVQGTMYFTLFGGEVEYAVLDSLGYEIQVIGNHEFDNGIDSLAHMYKNSHALKLSSNYDMSATPLANQFQGYTIKTYGGKRFGFFGINVNPKGMIVDANYAGMVYMDQAKVADATARYLKEVQGVDYVVMISHIGYDSLNPTEANDCSIAASSHYIDLIIGAHSHTLVKPGTEMAMVKNADGKPVIIGQNAKGAKVLGRYEIDLNSLETNYSHISIDKRLDAAASKYTAMAAWLAPFKHSVDSVMNNPVAHSAREMSKNGLGYLTNWGCDAVMKIIPTLYNGKVQAAILNKGGFRVDMPKGLVTEGLMGSMFPFDNRFVVLEITGKDLIAALKVMADKGGDATSKELTATFNANKEITSAKLNGKAIDKNKKYVIVTIDYLANGGDYMTPLKNATVLYRDTVRYGKHMLDYVRQLEAAGKLIDSTDEKRMVQK